ncbi:MAG: WD40 repeat domain-containing protein [Ignavibacteriaceae bacterium]|nr:WD40 repeat domain-containing protein [Ignavibacteriaceae bacterium]
MRVLRSIFLLTFLGAACFLTQVQAQNNRVLFQKSHSEGVLSIAVNSSETLLASGGLDDIIKVWDLNDNRLLLNLQGHTSDITALEFHPFKNILYSAGADAKIRVWDLSAGTEIETINAHNDVITSIKITPDGKYLLSGSYDYSVAIRDLETDEVVKIIKTPADVNSLAIHPSGAFAAYGTGTGIVKVFNIMSGDMIFNFQDQTDLITGLSFSSDGNKLASGCYDGSVFIYELNTDQQKYSIFSTIFTESEPVLTTEFAKDNRHVLAALFDFTVKKYNISSESVVSEMRGDNLLVNNILFMVKKGLIVTSSINNDIDFWKMDDGKPVYSIKGNSIDLLAVTVSPDGSELFFAGSDTTVYDLTLKGSFAEKKIDGAEKEITSLAVSFDGKLLASGSADGLVRIYEMPGGKFLSNLAGHTDGVSAVTFMNKDYTLVSGSYDRSIRVWDAISGLELKMLKIHNNFISALRLNHKGDYLYSAAGDKLIKMIRTTDWVDESKFEGHEGYIYSLDVHKSDSVIASGASDKAANLWNTNSLFNYASFREQKSGISAVLFTPDGKKLITAGEDRSIFIRDFDTREVLVKINGHTGRINAMAVIPGKNILASVSADGTVCLNEINTGKEVLKAGIFEGHKIVYSTPQGYFSFSDGAEKLISFQPGTPESVKLSKEEFTGYLNNLLK